jgi:co-chaperonin GroES (HSP10)
MNIDALQPLNDMVLLKATPPAQKEGSIFLPGCIEFSVWRSGEVVKVGPGLLDKKGRRVPVSVRPGQKVVFRYCGDKQNGLNDFEIVENDKREKYIFMRAVFLEFTMTEKAVA